MLIDNVSFSKEDKIRKGLCSAPEIYPELHPYLQALRDADRLEAIGQIGIERCIEFTKSIGGNVPADVVTHCYEKLLRLYDEKFIVSEEARKRAVPLH